jgi:hypothetical protein
MTVSRPLLAICCALLVSTAHSQQSPGAATIMARVAANQDQAEANRTHYVYVQHARVTSRKGQRVICEEITDSRVTPSASGSHMQLLSLNGRLLQNHTYLTYTKPLATNSAEPLADTSHDSVNINISDDDRDMVESMRSSFTQDDAKDGINKRLFPLTSSSQTDYVFHLVGRERMNGRDVFHLDFHPKDKDDFSWKGDAYIDAAAYQPVVVSTGMSRNIPLAVRTLLGTNVPGLGFTVTYAPQPDGLWFPVSFGTEFKVHVLFFFSREILIDAQNRDFEKTHVDSKIVSSGDPVTPQTNSRTK